MTNSFRIVAAAAFVGLASAASAQTVVVFGEDWTPAVNDVFFTDASRATLRPATDMATGWSKLSPDDQAIVLNACRGRLSGGNANSNSQGKTDTPIPGIPDASVTQICAAVGAP